MKRPKRIIDDLLLKMRAEGMEQKTIAAHFNVSPAAISKRLKQLTPPPPSPALDGLTPREQTFCREIASGRSQTAAALAAYNVGSINSAKTIGSRLMRKDGIPEAIESLLNEEGMTRRCKIRRLKAHADNADPNVSLRALDMGFKLASDYPIGDSGTPPPTFTGINLSSYKCDPPQWEDGNKPPLEITSTPRED